MHQIAYNHLQNALVYKDNCLFNPPLNDSNRVNENLVHIVTNSNFNASVTINRHRNHQPSPRY